MKNIDFLPEIYRHRRALRHTRMCWMGVGMLFGLAIAGTASGQWYFRSALAAQLRVVEPQYATAVLRQAELVQLESDKGRKEELAALYAYLEYPWPRTQLLAAVAVALPSSIQLMEVRLSEQANGAAAAPQTNGDGNRTSLEGEKGAKPTAKSVLLNLRATHDHEQTILELGGEAYSDKDVHEYVDALAKSPLFSSASLKGLESGGADKKIGSHFTIRVVVRPGYGQPGSPALKAGAAEVAVGGVSP